MLAKWSRKSNLVTDFESIRLVPGIFLLISTHVVIINIPTYSVQRFTGLFVIVDRFLLELINMSMTSIEDDALALKSYIKSYPDYPQPGMLFRWVHYFLIDEWSYHFYNILCRFCSFYNIFKRLMYCYLPILNIRKKTLSLCWFKIKTFNN